MGPLLPLVLLLVMVVAMVVVVSIMVVMAATGTRRGLGVCCLVSEVWSLGSASYILCNKTPSLRGFCADKC